MQLPSLPSRQFLVQSLLGQDMAECKPVDVCLPHQGGQSCLVQSRIQIVLSTVGHRPEILEGEGLSQHAGFIQDLPRVLPKACDTVQDRYAHRVGHFTSWVSPVIVRSHRRSTLHEIADYLLHEEGVSLCPVV